MSTPSEASPPRTGMSDVLRDAPRAPGSGHAEHLDWVGSRITRAFNAPTKEKGRQRVSILDRYLISEMAPPFAFAVAAFTVFLLINSFFLAAHYVINTHVPFGLVARYIVLQIPSYVFLILPFATLFSVLQGLGRLAGDNEITAMRTSGVALNRIARPTIILGVVVTLLAFFVNDYIAPQSQHKSQTVFREIAYNSTQPIIQADQFVRTEDGSHSIFVGSMDPQGVMHNIQIYSLGSGYFPETLTAASGRQISGKLVLYNGVHTTFSQSGFVTKQQHFDSLEFPLTDATLLFEGPRGPFEMDSRELAREIKVQRSGGADVRQLEMTLQMKYAMPVACLVSILIGFPLAIRFGKSGRGVGAMLALLVLVGYWLVMAATNALGQNGALPTFVAAWVPNIAMAGTGIAMLMKGEH
ncbi:MAG: LptF/LptG family permease [Candidatus Eremiobacteraeota bacterium]|nr:LptF/LptG family permease [Candidatus Eremiobacteraeota bacterium]